MPPARNRFPALDSIRGFAFLLVLAGHISGPLKHPTGLGQFGVWVFFVLSAFLLSLPFFEAPEISKRAFVWAAYLVHRTFRIFPPLFCAAVILHYSVHWQWEMVATNAIAMRGQNIFWTIYLETRYYLVLPFVVFLLIGLAKRPIILAIMIFATSAAVLIVAPFWEGFSSWIASDINGATLTTFVQYLPLFLAGTAMAYLYANASPRLLELNSRLFSTAFPLAVLLVVMITPSIMGATIGRRLPPGYYRGWWIPLLPVISAFVWLPLFANGRLGAFLSWRGFRFLGKISYSGYLYHVIFVSRLRFIEEVPVYILAVVAASIVTAALSHYLVERPFLALGYRLSAAFSPDLSKLSTGKRWAFRG